MKNYNAFINEAQALFEKCYFLNKDAVNNLNLRHCKGSFLAIRGEYYLNRVFNGRIYQHYFDLVILIDKMNHFVIPIIYLPNEIKPYGFEHMYPDNTCCLGLAHEIIQIWGKEQLAEDFFEKIVNIFLINLLSYRLSKRCVTEERPHNKEGVIDYYGELLGINGQECLNTLIYIYTKVKHNELARGHNLCPCKSGKILRNCHFFQIANFINSLNINPELKGGFLQDINSLIRSKSV